MTWTAGAPENCRLLPGVAHADPEIAAVADDGGNRFGKIVKVDDDVSDLFVREPSDDATDERFTANRHGRLRAFEGERTQPRAEARGEHERVPDQSASKSMS